MVQQSTQWCNKAGDVLCGHEKSDKSDNECSTRGGNGIQQAKVNGSNIPFVNNGFTKHGFTFKSNFKFSVRRKQRILYFTSLTLLHL